MSLCSCCIPLALAEILLCYINCGIELILLEDICKLQKVWMGGAQEGIRLNVKCFISIGDLPRGGTWPTRLIGNRHVAHQCVLPESTKYFRNATSPSDFVDIGGKKKV